MVTELPFVRRDALPENSHYYDDGCDLHPYCLTCPFAKCRYDHTQGLMTMRWEARVARAVELRGLDYTAAGAAAVMGTTQRSVFRMWATARKRRCDAMPLKVKSNSGILVLIGESSYGTT